KDAEAHGILEKANLLSAPGLRPPPPPTLRYGQAGLHLASQFMRRENVAPRLPSRTRA
ncbi:unnamed protein product, partial [Scytosiphon promiscuus]